MTQRDLILWQKKRHSLNSSLLTLCSSTLRRNVRCHAAFFFYKSSNENYVTSATSPQQTACNQLIINTPFHSLRRERALPYFVLAGRTKTKNAGSKPELRAQHGSSRSSVSHHAGDYTCKDHFFLAVAKPSPSLQLILLSSLSLNSLNQNQINLLSSCVSSAKNGLYNLAISSVRGAKRMDNTQRYNQSPNPNEEHNAVVISPSLLVLTFDQICIQKHQKQAEHQATPQQIYRHVST